MLNILTGAISTPSDTELIVGLTLLVILVIAISYAVGWLLCKLFKIHSNRRKKFHWFISVVTMLAQILTIAAFYFQFIY